MTVLGPIPPSSFPRVPLAVPYWNGATYREILRALSTGGVEGADISRLRMSVMEAIGVADALPCGSGSFALEIALQACGVRAGDEVVIPSFCCTTVVPPILAIGAIPILADIGEELNLTPETVETALTKKTRAVIVPHLFGNPAEIEAIVELASSKNIRVIDDAAQALGATIDGKPLGSFGDAGILSFGCEKVCAGLGGGVLVSRKKEILDGAMKVAMSPACRFLSVRNLLSTVIWRRWRRWTRPVEAAFHRRKADGPDAPPDPYRRESMANLNAAVAFSLMQTLGENIAARRARVDAYRELLGADERLSLILHRPGSACLTQVLRVMPRRRAEDAAAQIIETLGATGYEIQGSYVPIHLLAPYQQWSRNALPRTESVWEDLIELPCEPTVSSSHVERIAAIVKRVLNG